MATYPNPWEALIQSGMAGYQQQQVRRQQQAQQAEGRRRWQAEMNLRQAQAGQQNNVNLMQLALGRDQMRQDEEQARLQREFQERMASWDPSVLKMLGIEVPGAVSPGIRIPEGAGAGYMRWALDRKAEEANKLALPLRAQAQLGYAPDTKFSPHVLPGLLNYSGSVEDRDLTFGTPEQRAAGVNAMRAGLDPNDPSRPLLEALAGLNVSPQFVAGLLSNRRDMAQTRAIEDKSDLDRRLSPLERKTAIGVQQAQAAHTRRETGAIGERLDIDRGQFGLQGRELGLRYGPQLTLTGSLGGVSGPAETVLGIPPMPITGGFQGGGGTPVLPAPEGLGGALGGPTPPPGSPIGPPTGPPPKKWRTPKGGWTPIIGPPKPAPEDRARATAEARAEAQRRKDERADYKELEKKVLYDPAEITRAGFVEPTAPKYVLDRQGVQRMVREGISEPDLQRFVASRSGEQARSMPWYPKADSELKKWHSAMGPAHAVVNLRTLNLTRDQIYTVLQNGRMTFPKQIADLVGKAKSYGFTRSELSQMARWLYADVVSQTPVPAPVEVNNLVARGLIQYMKQGKSKR